MRLLNVGLGFPQHYVDQPTATRILVRGFGPMNRRSSKTVRRLHEATTVRGRYFALPIHAYLSPRTFAQANHLFIEVAADLAEMAIRDALFRSGLAVADVDLLIFVTTTGFAMPSIDVALSKRLGFRRDLKRLPVFGLGCVGGAAGISRCSEFVGVAPESVALLVAVELCSLTFQRRDVSTANLIATGLFGDGAACAVLAGSGIVADDGSAAEILGTRSVLYEQSDHILGWSLTDTGLRLVLSGDLPALVRNYLRCDVEKFLGDHGFSIGNVDEWVVHPGGPRVLRAVEEGLALPAAALRCSWESLRTVGNLSSVSVLHILREVIETKPPARSVGLMIGMGPGFSVELVLFRRGRY